MGVKVAKFLSSTQISYVYQVFISLLLTTANNSHGGRVLGKENASKLFIIYIVLALPSPRCTSAGVKLMTIVGGAQIPQFADKKQKYHSISLKFETV